MSRKLKPCGTSGGYGRHIYRKEPVCEPCAAAWREYQQEYDKTRDRSSHDKTDAGRVLEPCGTYGAAQRHKAYGEPLCRACERAHRDYQAEKARGYRAAKKRAGKRSTRCSPKAGLKSPARRDQPARCRW